MKTKQPKFRFKPNKNIDRPAGFTNGERAQRGEDMAACHPDYARCQNRGDELHDQVKDALTDFFHFCDRDGYDVAEMLGSAISNWVDERDFPAGFAVVRYPKQAKPGHLPDVSKLTGKELLNLYTDGLDASTDGRGFGGEHEAARLRLEGITPEPSGSGGWKITIEESHEDNTCKGDESPHISLVAGDTIVYAIGKALAERYPKLKKKGRVVDLDALDLFDGDMVPDHHHDVAQFSFLTQNKRVAVAVLAQPYKQNRAFVVLEGGLVQDVLADDPHLDVTIIDHDLPEADASESKRIIRDIKANLKLCKNLPSVL